MVRCFIYTLCRHRGCVASRRAYTRADHVAVWQVVSSLFDSPVPRTVFLAITMCFVGCLRSQADEVLGPRHLVHRLRVVNEGHRTSSVCTKRLNFVMLIL